MVLDIKYHTHQSSLDGTSNSILWSDLHFTEEAETCQATIMKC